MSDGSGHSGGDAGEISSGPIVIALAGNPNCGKTTLFNAITGARQHVANYPGVTVERRFGDRRINGREARFVDLPGAYGLTAASLDEGIALQYLTREKPHALINVVDASNLARNLDLTLQLLDCGQRVVVALNMSDVAKRRGISIDTQFLSEALGAPVVPTVARVGSGVEEAAAEAVRLAGENGNGTAVIRPILEDSGPEGRRKAIARICEGAVKRSRVIDKTLSDRVDDLALHPVIGIPILIGVFAAAYWFAFTLSDTAILSWVGIPGTPGDWIEGACGLLGRGVAAVVPDGPLQSLLVSGVIGGVGAVLSFVPLIFLMFLAISVIEDSGYMARAACLADTWLRRFGLPGEALLPLLVSGGLAGGCAVPGIMATRALRDPKQRLTAILVCPFMNCGAKLPVYAMLIAAFFAGHQTRMMLILGAISWFLSLGAAWGLRKTVTAGVGRPFLLEMPPYHLPTWRNMLLHGTTRAAAYIKRAGTIILAVSVLLWALMAFPRLPAEKAAALADNPAQLAEEQLAHSVAGRMGKGLVPVLNPLGLDWRVGVALVGGLPAKEVVLSTLGTAYSLGEVDPEESAPLTERLASDPGWSPLAAFTLMIFVMLYAPCMATIAMIVQETGSWKWGAFSLVFSTAAAWVLAFAVHQAGLWMGWGV